MDSAIARSDLDLIKDIVQKSSQRIDAHTFHCVHWGIIVLIWYPFANWLTLRGETSWLIGLGILAVVLGVLLSTIRGARASIHPRLPDCNMHISRQVIYITAANITAGVVLSAISTGTGFISGIAIFLGCIAAVLFQEYNGYILGPCMGLGMLIPGLRAEARVRNLLKTADPVTDSSETPA